MNGNCRKVDCIFECTNPFPFKFFCYWKQKKSCLCCSANFIFNLFFVRFFFYWKHGRFWCHLSRWSCWWGSWRSGCLVARANRYTWGRKHDCVSTKIDRLSLNHSNHCRLHASLLLSDQFLCRLLTTWMSFLYGRNYYYTSSYFQKSVSNCQF